MGNEVSTNSTTPSSSMSFFSTRSQSQPPGSSTMITINSGHCNQTPENDPDVVKLNEIPKFLPIMKSTILPTSNSRDIYRQINPKLLYDKFSELHLRMNENARFIQAGQLEVFSKIKKTDVVVRRICNELKNRENKYKRLDCEMLKLHTLHSNIEDIYISIENICENIKEINSCLFDNQKMPPIYLGKNLKKHDDNDEDGDGTYINNKIIPAYEHTVVDAVDKRK
uniref:BLOC-1-related complex subunit 5 n=1 Tax=Parastrongyloides trichosuri TaxID=131310 RepID=A0A0N5A5L4_PARTI